MPCLRGRLQGPSQHAFPLGTKASCKERTSGHQLIPSEDEGRGLSALHVNETLGKVRQQVSKRSSRRRVSVRSSVWNRPRF